MRFNFIFLALILTTAVMADHRDDDMVDRTARHHGHYSFIEKKDVMNPMDDSLLATKKAPSAFALKYAKKVDDLAIDKLLQTKLSAIPQLTDVNPYFKDKSDWSRKILNDTKLETKLDFKTFFQHVIDYANNNWVLFDIEFFGGVD